MFKRLERLTVRLCDTVVRTCSFAIAWALTAVIGSALVYMVQTWTRDPVMSAAFLFVAVVLFLLLGGILSTLAGSENDHT